VAPPGQQFAISQGEHRPPAVTLGGGLRRYGVGDRELLDGYAGDERCTGSPRVPFTPWANRIREGN
jgi:aldose 1-epimerase